MKILSLSALLVLAACATSPLSYSGLTDRATGDAFTCAMRQLNVLEYTVEDTDRDSGFIRGTKQTSGLGTAIFAGARTHGQLTIIVFEGDGGGETTMRVTAAKLIESGILGLAGREDTGKPDDDGIADAHEVLASCGVPEGQVIEGA